MTKSFYKLGFHTLRLPRYLKVFIALTVDVSFCVLATWLAYYFRLGEFVALSNRAFIVVTLSTITAIVVFYLFGLYREIFRYSGFKALLTVFRAILVYGLIFSSVITAISIDGVPRTVGFIQPLLLLFLVGLSRIFVRVWLGSNYQFRRKNRKRILIYGAGTAGRQLAAAMENSTEMRVIGFLDDDERLHGQSLNGLTIYSPNELVSLVLALQVNDIFLAMPKVSRKRRNVILNRIRDAKVSVRTLPSVTDLAQGKVTVSDIRELDLDDLLGRDPVKPNQIFLAKNITKKTVIVTGAGGSLGSELCRQIVMLNPKKLLLIEQSESALYEIHKELESKINVAHLIPLLVSTQNEVRIKEIMETWLPDTVYHAAAYKHVPLVEQNIVEGLKNNVIGTLIMVQAAVENNVENFVLVSTDKAVRPTNVMGASKRLAEMILQAQAAEKVFSKLSIVRFGNVLGSSGSVVPRFREQIKSGGPITLTHSEITRFFMTIPEASQLVIQAGAMTKGGDVFLLDMGEPVKILELAQRMIELSGLTVKNSLNQEGDIEIEIIGLRPGEKLYEELLIGKDAGPTAHKRIMRGREHFIKWKQLERELAILQKAINCNDVKTIRLLLKRLVSGYDSTKPIVDLVHEEKK